jgi:gliding motility-associated-like protein
MKNYLKKDPMRHILLLVFGLFISSLFNNLYAMPGGCAAAANIPCSGGTTVTCNDPTFNAGSGGSINCNTATPIPMPGCNSCISGTTANSQDGTTTTYNPCGSADGIVWFTFTAPDANNTFTLTPGTLQNPLIVISTEPCGSGVFNTCASGTGTNPITASWAMTPGQQAYIGVASTTESAGTFNLCVQSLPPPPGPGNTCATANVICETTGQSVPMACATASGQTPSCFGSAPQQDTWITFTVLQNGTIAWTGDPDANAEFDWALWNVTNGCPGTQVSCNYNFAGSCGTNFGMGTAGGEFNGTINATAGQTYAIQIDNFSGNGVGFNFTWQGTAVITPTAGFTMNNNFSCTGSLNVNFTHTGVGPATYNFGNGNTYTGTNPPTQTYGIGTFPITATATSATCTDVFTSFVTVYGPLAANITATPSLCNAPCTGSVSVSNVTGGDGIYTYLWSNGATTNSINNVCPGNYSVTISNATCGTQLVLNATVGVQDIIPPTGTPPANITVQCIGNVPAPNIASVTGVSDNLDPAPVVTFIGDVSSGTCPQIITRTYRITDHCGLFTNVVQTITVNDNTPPSGTAPANVTVQCIANVPAPNVASVTALSDNCGGTPIVTHIGDVSNGATCPQIITRTYRITDACGNFTDVTQTITINDTTPPAGTAPAAITVQCIADVPAPNTALVTGLSDNCGGTPTVTHLGDVSNGATCPQVITRTYRITDACGNFTDVTQTITINDTTPPVGTAPAAITVQCIADVPAPNTALVTGLSDNCGGTPTIIHLGDVSNGATCPQIITRTYRITDACGNFTDVTQTITINDTTPPAGTAPAAITVQCVADVPAPNTALVTGLSDNCGAAPIVTHLSDVSNGATCPQVITRTYRITDACGNFTDVTQTITIDDTTPPSGTAPAAITVQCVADVPAPNTASVTALSDNCGGTPTVTHLSDVSNGATCPQVITRTYRITDGCGNFTDVTQTITIDDTTPPAGTAPATVNVQCAADVPAPNTALVTALSDNCGGTPTVTYLGDVSDGNACPETITRTYRITDACGNFTDVTQTIIVNDNINPTASNPADVTITDPADFPPVNPADVPNVSDNCTANPLVEWVSDVSDGGLCPENITRTYSVTDDCGNQIFVSHVISIGAGGSPTASNPDPINVQCIADVPAPDPAVVTDALNDDGTPATVAWENDQSNGQTCPQVITRTYRVTNTCAVSIFVQQIITVNDDIAPAGTAPAAVTVQCIGDVPAPNTALVTGVSDNCTANPLVAHVSDVSDGNTCPETITRTYSITDDCGNQTLVTQTITINDDIAPLGTAPAAVTVQCIGDVPAADVSLVTGVSDNCTANPVVAFVSDVSNNGTCPEIITRTYSITDACGNETLVTQTITVNDNINPTASNPATITVPGGPAPAPDISVVTDAADNCTVNPVVAWVSDVSDNQPCPETITRTYSVTDDCGNSITVTQLILITDPFPPTASNPAPIAVQCIGDVPAPDIAVVTDADDNQGAPVVTWEDDTSNGQTCPEIITRRYRVTDLCGNFIFVEQIITVNDDIAPVGTAPADVTVSCPSDFPTPNINSVTGVSDNCTVNPVVAHVNDVTVGTVCNGQVVTRTYSITDACGNQTLVTQTINITAITPTFGITSTNPTACNTATGSITLTGLNPNTAYELVFGNATVVITTDATGNFVIANLPAGTYTPFTVQPVGCPACASTNNSVINLVDPNAPPVNAGPDQTVCQGVEVTLTAVNPNGANISWNNGVNDGVPFIAPIGSTTYTVTAELNNCFSTDVVVINVTPLPIVNAGPDQVVCAGQQVTLSGSGATSYVWNNGVTNGVPFVPTQTTTYTVVGTTNGCSSQDQVTVIVNPLPQVTFVAEDFQGCVPVEVSFVNTTNNVTSVNCQWTIQNGPTLNGCNVSHTFNSAGCFAVTLTVTSDQGCTASSTIPNFVCVENVPIASFQVQPEYLTTLNGEAIFTNGSIGASTYQWNFGDGNSSTAVNPIHNYNGQEEGTYIIELIAYSASGCSDTAYAVLQMREELIFYVPNTFTPDGDAYNETFFPVFTSGFDPFDYHMTIFNRWGEILFESYNHQVGWDGTYGGKIVKDGTYIWKIEFATKYTDERKVHHGHVNILR